MDAESHEITCAADDLNAVREILEDRFGEARESGLVWKPTTTTPIDQEKAETLFRLFDVLDDSDDVQSVSANYEVSDDVLERLSA